ncbi:MAG: hypothetical protein MUF42_07335 [Cytophagaceae bacterium]|jgi:hypothetical protein|nr:hypothetical protein [Cytophagaceae bacterium]
MIAEKETNSIPLSDRSLVLAIVLSALIPLSIQGLSAYQYNDIDMLPFWERKKDVNFIPQDFFTNASQLPNARHVWGYLIHALAALFGGHWYGALYFVKLLLIIAIPVAYFLVITKWLHQLTSEKNSVRNLFVALACMLMCSNSYAPHFFAMAWWPPLQPDANAHNLSILFGLLALHSFPHWKAIPALVACLALHPSLGIFFTMVSVWYYWKSFRNDLLLSVVTLISVVLPLVAQAYFFSPQTPLDVSSFFKIYIEYKHAPHYLPSQFGSMAFSTKLVYFWVLILLLGVAGYAWKNKIHWLLKASAVVLLGLHAILLIQWIWVEKYPVKFFCILGPSRYLLFTAWALILMYAYLFATWMPDRAIRGQSWGWISSLKVQGGMAAGCAALFCYVLFSIDNPPVEKDKPCLAWIRSHTPPDAVIATQEFIIDEMDVRYLARRAVFAGECFPFHEDAFLEYYHRARLIYGDKKNWTRQSNPVLHRYSHYQQLQPSDWIEASSHFTLDYFILEAKSSYRMAPVHPVYADADFCIFSMRDLVREPSFRRSLLGQAAN